MRRQSILIKNRSRRGRGGAVEEGRVRFIQRKIPGKGLTRHSMVAQGKWKTCPPGRRTLPWEREFSSIFYDAQVEEFRGAREDKK